jgi:hypothetical protein
MGLTAIGRTTAYVLAMHAEIRLHSVPRSRSSPSPAHPGSAQMLLTRYYGSFVKPAWTKCRSNAKALRMPSFCMTRKEMQSVRE